ncbi:MAG: 4-hydroxy-3-methylbut-2-enyl diphosphate reductase [Candidatus Woesearchaeota archaeon]|nr:4-hydroxy-3-methylbut-2-enyl diphosphate reductase [Candidatus Woesearchaeota archaeon]
MLKRIILASPRGYCAGVERAISSVENAILKFKKQVYVLNEIVHNEHVIKILSENGARFVNSLSDVPKGSVIILSAHGVSPKIRDDAFARGLSVIDATCPFVSRLHSDAREYSRKGFSIILIGYSEHAEAEGLKGEAPMAVIENISDAEKIVLHKKNIACLVQTTFSVEERDKILSFLKKRFPNLEVPSSGICCATENRQNAVKALSKKCDAVIIVGSKKSSNSMRLFETAKGCCSHVFLVGDEKEIKKIMKMPWFWKINSLGISSGASTPEKIVQKIVAYIVSCAEKRNGKSPSLENLESASENISFPLPSPFT